MAGRLISFHHRLSHLGGHKYAEVTALMPAAKARGLEFLLFMHEAADAAIRQAFPEGHAVLHDLTFQTKLSFDQRCRDFASMLNQHLAPIMRANDWLFVTTATQCEIGGLVYWLRELPEGKRPWIFACFHSDRWNRYGAQERARQVAEFRTVARGLAQSPRDVVRRLAIGAAPEGLCREVGELLGISVTLTPLMLPSSPYASPEPRGAGEAVVAFLGGSRPEKGAHLLAGIFREMIQSTGVKFLVQIANEQLSPEQLAELCEAAAGPNVRAIYGTLEQSNYRSLLAETDILLLPYERIPYRLRTSAIFAEAAAAGRPIVVPCATWMSEQIESGRAAGVTYEGDDVRAIAAAVQGAVANLPKLLEQAKHRAPHLSRTLDVGWTLDWFAEEIERRRRSGAKALFARLAETLRLSGSR